MKPRQRRTNVFLRARLRHGPSWSDALIVNASSRGLGLQALSPPRRGEFIEVRKGRACIIAQVMWSDGGRFGVRTQDDVNLDYLTGNPLPGHCARAEDMASTTVQLRWKPVRRHSEVAERNRLVAHAGQFVAVGVAAAAAAVGLTDTVHRVVAAPASLIVQAMKTGTGSAH